MRGLKISVIFTIISLIVIMANYAIAANNEEEKVRAVVETFYAGYRTKNLDLLMSTISPGFLMSKIIGKAQDESVTEENDDQGKTALLGYERFKEMYSERFKTGIV